MAVSGESLLLEEPQLVGQWRRALVDGTIQLDHVEKVLRSPWVANLYELIPDGPADLISTEEWSEVIVIAVTWTHPPGAHPSEVILGVPGGTSLSFPEESYVTLAAFAPDEEDGPGDGDQGCDTIQVALRRVPADRLSLLAESTPRDEEVLSFSGIWPGALPDVAMAFASMDQNGFEGSVVFYLGGGDRADQCMLCMTCVRGPVDECYVSAVEVEPGEARLALSNVQAVGAQGRSAGSGAANLITGGTTRGQALRGLSPRPRVRQGGSRKKDAEQDTPAGSGAREVPAAKRAAARPKAKATAARGRSGSSAMTGGGEASAEVGAMVKLMQDMASRLERLEGRQLSSPQGAASRVAEGCASTPGNIGVPHQGSSLLAQGRVPLPGPRGGAGTAVSAGGRAYASAMAEARSLLGEQGAPGVGNGPGGQNAERPPPAGRERNVEGLIKAAVDSGGDLTMAVQLAILQQLEKMGGQKDKNTPQTLEDVLYGSQVPVEGEGASSSTSGGFSARGAQNLLRVQRSQEQQPGAWSGLADETALRQLGSDVTGMPWSMMAYGQQKLPFTPKLEHLQRTWHLLCHFHALSRQGRHQDLDLAITQALKSVEQATLAGGNWKVAWTLTSLPDPIERNQSGLTHPAELSAAVQWVKEQNTLEELLR
eukprot:6465012-Amphidinium_carterae.1